ncbi:hypothetical protein [Dyadobacter luticola]|uniref:Uncharacterized protein n=1 Tax=Dyadobacter luticola TaxID=1979387 RepID=A0A5R9L5X5_9BACT|nr:hypothetical protein [Dyadobacter luticola]TLV03982.1 hypothetical protein FEN17_10485 [Dyadobacter luticola]
MAKKFIVSLVLAGVFLAVYSFILDWKFRYDRPWAFASGSNTATLVGSWQGDFKDPDGITKHIEMVIAEPEQKKRNRSKSRGFNHQDELRFTGTAVIKSRLGVENDRISGLLKSDDGHDIDKISFSPINEEKKVRESFNVSMSETGSTWQDDVIQLKLSFTYVTKTGAGFSDSADDRFDKKIPVTLHRK